MRTVLSSLPLATAEPSGEKTAARTQLAWPASVRRKRRVGTEKILQVLSSLQVSSRWPSAEKSTPRTACVCGLSASDLPCTEPGAQSRTVWSALALASSEASGE